VIDSNVKLPRVELEIVRGQARRKRRPVNVPAFLIGASQDCDLVLGDAQFAEVHAYLIVHAGGVSIRHLGFGPELLINGEQIARASLQDGDRLCTGPYEFVITIRDELSGSAGPIPIMESPMSGWTSNSRKADVKSLTSAAQLLSDIRLAIASPQYVARNQQLAAS
jgi:pSer/pThr/pTyr-binding forkhead associated (FHA) protein